MIKKHDNIELLRRLMDIPNFDENNLSHLDQLHKLSIQSIVDTGGVLPGIPPFEKHPYIEPLDVNTTATGLMIGTFPPITYFCDLVKKEKLTFNGKSSQGLKQPAINYFHGNKGTLWDHVPFNFDVIIANEDRNERKRLLKIALDRKNILYTDIIQYCQRELGQSKNGKSKYTANDTDLHCLVFNQNLIDFIFDNQTMNRIYFTNSYMFGMGGRFFNKSGQYSLTKNDAFQLFLKALDNSGIQIEVEIPNSDFGWILINEDSKMKRDRRKNLNHILCTKAIVKMRLTKNTIIREFALVSSVSPSATGKTRPKSQKNVCVIKFAGINHISIDNAPKLMLEKTLELFFSNQLAQLANYNV